MPDSRRPHPAEGHDPGSAPWRLGLLTLLAILLVIGGVLMFGGASAEDTGTTEAGAQADITIPPLPEFARTDEAAPDFTLDLFDGTTFTLSRHLADDGRPVILNLWASWCPPCRDEMPDLDTASLANPEVLILGVAVDDDPVAARDFAEEIEITYPAGFDETGRVGRSYPTHSLPVTFVIAADGRLIQTVFGRLTPGDIDLLIAGAIAGQIP